MKNTCRSCKYLWEATSTEDPCKACVEYSHWTAATDTPSADTAKDRPCYRCKHRDKPGHSNPCWACLAGGDFNGFEQAEPSSDTAKADQGNPHMSYDERKAAYRDAIDRWGRYGQIWMAVEEMSELTNALCKLRRDRCSVHDVAEEIADVTIMMEQLRMIFDVNEEVSGIMDKKIRRLNRRITLSEEGDNDG